MNPLDSLVIRPGAPGDHAKVTKDWLLSFATSDFAHFCTPRPDWQKRASQLYFHWQKQVIARALRDGELWVASWGEDTSTIAGWCVLERNAGPVVGRQFRIDGFATPEAHITEREPWRATVVHYVYVNDDYRAHGIAKRLLAPALEEPIVVFSHRTPLAKHLPIPPGWHYDPRPALLGPLTKEEAHAAQDRK